VLLKHFVSVVVWRFNLHLLIDFLRKFFGLFWKMYACSACMLTRKNIRYVVRVRLFLALNDWSFLIGLRAFFYLRWSCSEVLLAWCFLPFYPGFTCGCSSICLLFAGAVWLCFASGISCVWQNVVCLWLALGQIFFGLDENIWCRSFCFLSAFTLQG